MFLRAQRRINDSTNHEQSMDGVELGAVGSSSYAGVSAGTDGTGHYTNKEK